MGVWLSFSVGREQLDDLTGELFLISRWREPAARNLFADSCTSRGLRHAGSGRIPTLRGSGRDRGVSRNGQLLDASDSRKLAAREILVEVPQILPEILEALTLRPVIRIVLEVSQPHPVVFPPHDLGSAHSQSPRQGSPVFDATCLPFQFRQIAA